MQLFVYPHEVFDAQLEQHPLVLRGPIRSKPPNCSYRVRGVPKRDAMGCGVIVGYKLIERPNGVIVSIDPNAPKPQFAVAVMAFLIKPVMTPRAIRTVIVVDQIPLDVIEETHQTPEEYYEQCHNGLRHPLTWLGLIQEGTRQFQQKETVRLALGEEEKRLAEGRSEG